MHQKVTSFAGYGEAETSMKLPAHSGEDEGHVMQNLATDEGKKRGSPSVHGPRPSF